MPHRNAVSEADAHFCYCAISAATAARTRKTKTVTAPTASNPRHLHHDSFRFILLVGLVTSFQAMCTTLTLPALPAIAQGFATTPDMAQLTISLFLIGVACGQIISGALSDRFGRRPILLGGIGLSVMAGFGCTFSQSIETLIALRFLQGFGGAASMVLGRAIVRDRFDRDHALKAMSAISAIISIVPMAGPPITGIMMQWMSWRVIYGALSLIGLVLGFLVWMLIAESLKKPDPTATDPRRIAGNCWDMLKRPESVGFMLVGACTYGGLFSFLAIISFITIDTFHLSSTTAGWLLGASSVASWLGALFNNRISGRFPVKRILRISTACTLLSALLVLTAAYAVTQGLIGGTAGIVAIMVPVAAYTFTFGVTHPTTIVLYLHPVPHIAGTASALGASVQMVAGATFAWLSAYLYSGTPMALGYCMVIAGGLAFLIFTFVSAKYTPG